MPTDSRRWFLVTALLLLTASPTASAAENPALELVGLWEAKRSFGPEIRGALEIYPSDGALFAEISGYRVPAAADERTITFEIPGDRGDFHGRLREDGRIVGHWVQPRTRHAGMRAASPVVLHPDGTDV